MKKWQRRIIFYFSLITVVFFVYALVSQANYSKNAARSLDNRVELYVKAYAITMEQLAAIDKLPEFDEVALLPTAAHHTYNYPERFALADRLDEIYPYPVYFDYDRYEHNSPPEKERTAYVGLGPVGNGMRESYDGFDKVEVIGSANGSGNFRYHVFMYLRYRNDEWHPLKVEVRKYSLRDMAYVP